LVPTLFEVLSQRLRAFHLNKFDYEEQSLSDHANDVAGDNQRHVLLENHLDHEWHQEETEECLELTDHHPVAFCEETVNQVSNFSLICNVISVGHVDLLQETR